MDQKLIVGQVIWHNGTKKKIIRLFPNIKNETVIEWESHKPYILGTCMPNLWAKWKLELRKSRRDAHMYY